jgi:multiple sugar transport system permease protein
VASNIAQSLQGPLLVLIARRVRERTMTYSFFYPAFLLVAAVSFLPLFYAIRQSVYSADYLELGDFVGLQNYTDLFNVGGGLWNLRSSFYFVGGTLALAIPLGVLLAVLLNRPILFRNFFRTILIFPWVVAQVVTGLLWMWLYDSRLGPLVDALGRLGITLPNPLTDVNLAMPSLIITNVWRSYPLVMVFTIAALQTVPVELTEAARIDVPSAWNRFWYVTFPLIKNTILVAVVLTTLHTFNTVTMVLVMTGGGPVDATQVLALRVFREGFQFYRMDIATTCAMVIFLLNIVFTLVFLRVLRREGS